MYGNSCILYYNWSVLLEHALAESEERSTVKKRTH